VITIAKPANATLRDLNIVGGLIGVHLLGAKHSNVWNSRITQSIEAGIWLEGSSENEISHNILTKIGGARTTSGVRLSAGSSDNTLASNQLSEIKGRGFWLYEKSNDNWLSKNTVQEASAGIYVQGTGDNRLDRNLLKVNTNGIQLLDNLATDINNNRLFNNTRGLLIQGGSKLVVFDNTVNSSKVEGVKLSNADAKITENEIFASGTDGLLLEQGDNSVVEQNLIAEHANGAGIHIKDSKNVIVRDNTLFNNAKGIWVDPSFNIQLALNRVYHSADEGILVENSVNTEIVSGNRIVSASEGILLLNSPHTSVLGNLFNLTQTAIRLEDSDRSTIHGNQIERTDIGIMLLRSNLNRLHNNSLLLAGVGISLTQSSANHLSSNTITESSEVGIKLNSASMNNRLVGNHLAENGIGVHIVDPTSIRNTLLNNTMSMNNIGVRLENARATVLYHNNFLDNTIQAEDTLPTANYFFNPTLQEGNYWSDYTGVDVDHDGIGDTLVPHPAPNFDRFPLVNKDGWMLLILTPSELKLEIQKLNLSPIQEQLLLTPLNRATKQTLVELPAILPTPILLKDPVYRPITLVKPITTVTPVFTLQPITIKPIIQPIIKPITPSSKALQTKLQPIIQRNLTAYPIKTPLQTKFTVVEPALAYKDSALQMELVQAEWNKNVEYAQANWHLVDDPVVVAFLCYSWIQEINIGWGIVIYVVQSPDWDDDGIGCHIENAIGTNPYDSDTDDDGMPDGYEYYNNLDPLSDDRNVDTDGDGLTNWLEYQMGTKAGNPDSDGDDLDDGDELVQGTNILDNDTDNDGLRDGWEVQHRRNANVLGATINVFNPLWPIITINWGWVVFHFPEGALDYDGDGLSASYEHSMRNLGADPWVKDILVEVDYVQGQEPTDTDGDGSEDDFADVVDAFDDYNINLIYDIDDELPADSYTSNSEAGDHYDNDFSSWRVGKWRYSILANSIQCACSGYAFDIPNDMFIVARGRVYQWWDDITNPFGSDHAEAGTWMHELGHTLGLKHGGSDHGNWKRNYYSVLNYYYQVKGLFTSTERDPPSQSGTQGPLSYSDGSARTLDEDNLSEPQGIGKGYGIDWNNDGDTSDTGRSYDVNGDGDTNDVIADYDDWTYLITHLDETLVHNSP